MSAGELRVSYELLTLPLPFALWFVAFRLPILGFWPTLTGATAVLLIVTIPRWGRVNFSFAPRQTAVGILAAVLLYLFFWGGYQVAKSIPGFLQTISSIYNLRGNTATLQIAEVLLFPIGPAEELYWRGFIQGHLRELVGPNLAVILTSALYTLIHLPTLNPSLILVALIGGLVWGFLYKMYDRILPLIFSHVVFDELIFVLFVIS